MQLVVGNYGFGVNQTLISTALHTLWNRLGQPYAQMRTLSVSGYLATSVTTGNINAQQLDLTQRENALKTALAVPYPNIVFYMDSGIASSETLLNAGSTTGVRIVDGPNFPESKGPEYATIRTFNFKAEAEYPLPNAQNFALDFRETLSFGGGGSLNIFRPCINGPFQKQLVYPQVPYTCMQNGTITGYKAYLPPAPQKFPGDLLESPNIVQVSPQRVRVTPFLYQGFETTWTYKFASTGPLVAQPTLYQG